MSLISYLFGPKMRKSHKVSIPPHNMLIGKHPNDFRLYPGLESKAMLYGYDCNVYPGPHARIIIPSKDFHIYPQY